MWGISKAPKIIEKKQRSSNNHGQFIYFVTYKVVLINLDSGILVQARYQNCRFIKKPRS